MLMAAARGNEGDQPNRWSPFWRSKANVEIHLIVKIIMLMLALLVVTSGRDRSQESHGRTSKRQAVTVY
jgi:hypothetical protein